MNAAYTMDPFHHAIQITWKMSKIFQGFDYKPITLTIHVVNKRPFVNGYKGAFCGPAQRKALGFYKVSAIREPSQTIAHACYIRSASAL